MLEVVFSQSVEGLLKYTLGSQMQRGRTVSAFVYNTEDSAMQQEQKKLQREMEEREQRNWASAVSLEMNASDIVCFSLALSVGEIDEDIIGAKREAAMRLLLSIEPPEIADGLAEQLEKTRGNLRKVLDCAANGEPIRIWVSKNPDEACGLYWLIAQLYQAGVKKPEITLASLPDYVERPDGTVVEYQGWGEVAPHEVGAFAMNGKKLPVNCVFAIAQRWKELQEENTPLRAILNGKLVSVPETQYDSFILRSLSEQENEFYEASAIGNILAKNQLGVGDAWIALRIERFIEQGLFEPVTEPKEGECSYRRILRKCGDKVTSTA